MPLLSTLEKHDRFRKLCEENGLDPDDQGFGSPTLTAWLWFNLGIDEVENKESDIAYW